MGMKICRRDLCSITQTSVLLQGRFPLLAARAVEKLMKPDEEIFHRLFQKFSLKPAECFLVDDMEENVLAGKKCGMEGFVFGSDRVEELEGIL